MNLTRLFSHSGRAFVENIIHSFIQPGIPDGLLLVKPRPESLQNRFFLLETQLFPLFIITGILFVNGVFHGKQPIAVLDSLYCRLAVASYVISVRRIKSSLTASFRFYLTIDTLAVQLYTSLSPRRVRDFHPLERAHGAQTKNTLPAFTSRVD